MENQTHSTLPWKSSDSQHGTLAANGGTATDEHATVTSGQYPYITIGGGHGCVHMYAGKSKTYYADNGLVCNVHMHGKPKITVTGAIHK